MVERVLPSTVSATGRSSQAPPDLVSLKVTSQSTFLEVLVISAAHLLIHCGCMPRYPQQSCRRAQAPSVCLPLASMWSHWPSRWPEATSNQCRTITPQPSAAPTTMVSRVLLKVQVMVRSSIAHSLTVCFTPGEGPHRSERRSRLRAGRAAGSEASRRSGLSIAGIPGEFQLEDVIDLTEVLSASTPLALSSRVTGRTAIDGLLAAGLHGQ